MKKEERWTAQDALERIINARLGYRQISKTSPEYLEEIETQLRSWLADVVEARAAIARGLEMGMEINHILQRLLQQKRAQRAKNQFRTAKNEE